MDPTIITWDWKEQPPWVDVLDALNATYADGPKIFEVDSGNDEYAIVIGNRTMSQTEAQAWFENHQYDEV